MHYLFQVYRETSGESHYTDYKLAKQSSRHHKAPGDEINCNSIPSSILQGRVPLFLKTLKSQLSKRPASLRYPNDAVLL